MRLLLANPNTTQAVTDLVERAARRVVPPGTTVRAVTARFGAAIIGTRAELAVAEHAALDLLSREIADCDAAIIAASTDSGLRAAREALAVPILGLTESALHVACLTGARFATLTLSRRSAALLRELIDGYGLASRRAAQGFVDATPRDLLEDPDRVASMLIDEAQPLIDAGADCVVLVGAVMAEVSPRVQAALPVPVLEGLACAIALAGGLAWLRLPRPTAGSYAAPDGRVSTGLGPPLADLLRTGSQ